ncbi:MAG: hypothetical protein IPO07_21980 [Haliscomenobacter sp.]|nr:hypothetical protein [Haliscomenobacter sp.]MBK9491156.1 hypothetical protein [Haliscomenobacter sp.]
MLNFGVEDAWYSSALVPLLGDDFRYYCGRTAVAQFLEAAITCDYL